MGYLFKEADTIEVINGEEKYFIKVTKPEFKGNSFFTSEMQEDLYRRIGRDPIVRDNIIKKRKLNKILNTHTWQAYRDDYGFWADDQYCKKCGKYRSDTFDVCKGKR